MINSQINQILDNKMTSLALPELRQKWAAVWGKEPHARIGRAMLEKSLEFQLRQRAGSGLSLEQQKRLDNFVASYKRSPKVFEEGAVALKPGTRLVRMYQGEKHSIHVLADGFEYQDKKYTSLSDIAFTITGTRWNGWIFFGLKKRGAP